MSDEHFSVDGTLVKAWASMKSFQPKAEGSRPMTTGPLIRHDKTPPQSSLPNPNPNPMPRAIHQHRNAEVDFRGEKRSNAKHV